MLLQNENHAEQVSVGDEPSACTSSSLAHSLALTHTLSSFTHPHTHTHAHAHAHTLSRSKAEKTVTAKNEDIWFLPHLLLWLQLEGIRVQWLAQILIRFFFFFFILHLLQQLPIFFIKNFFWSFYFLCRERKITSVRNAKKWCLLYQWGWRSSWVTLDIALEMMLNMQPKSFLAIAIS